MNMKQKIDVIFLFRKRKCNVRSFMESLISQTKQISISGMNPTQPLLEPSVEIILPSNQALSQTSVTDSQLGEHPRTPESVNRQLPTAEKIGITKPLLKRSLKMTNDEFYQWRQVLGTFQKSIRTALNSNDH